MDQDLPEFQPLTRSEMSSVIGVILLAQFVMFLCGTPVPHHDASQYIEPGIILATDGKLARPCDQYYDLSYKIAFFAYPPGFPLVVASWVKIFGRAEISMLAFTHIQHSLLLTTVWILARSRFGVSRISAALAVLSLFPFHHHGRPDLTSSCIAALAWLVIPVSGIGMRLSIGGMLLGMSVLTSPHYGASAAAAVGTYAFIACNQSNFWRIVRLGILIFVAVSVNVIIVAILLSMQDAWAIAFYQWKAVLQFRVHELNTMPSLINPYAIKFCLIPLGLFTLLPATLALFASKSATGGQVKISALCFLAGFFVWYMTNKNFLLYIGHFAYLARPLFQAALMSAQSQILKIVGYVSCTVLILTHFHLESRDFVLLFENPRPSWEECRRLIPDGAIVATDGVLFLSSYKPSCTISYESYKIANRWELYRSLWPQELRERFDDVFRPGPQKPDMIVISTGTNEAFGPPDPNLYRRLGHLPPILRRKLFGIQTSYPMDYYHPVVYEKIRVFTRRP